MAPPESILHHRVAKFYSLIMAHWGGWITTSRSADTMVLVGFTASCSMLRFSNSLCMEFRCAIAQSAFKQYFTI